MTAQRHKRRFVPGLSALQQFRDAECQIPTLLCALRAGASNQRIGAVAVFRTPLLIILNHTILIFLAMRCRLQLPPPLLGQSSGPSEMVAWCGPHAPRRPKLRPRGCEGVERRQRPSFGNTAQEIEGRRISPMPILECQHHRLNFGARDGPGSQRPQLPLPHFFRRQSQYAVRP